MILIYILMIFLAGELFLLIIQDKSDPFKAAIIGVLAGLIFTCITAGLIEHFRPEIAKPIVTMEEKQNGGTNNGY